MPDLSAKIATARKAGYSDDEITSFLSKDSSLAPKIQTATKAGYSAAEIVNHLTQPAGYDKAKAKIASADQNGARAYGKKLGLGGLGALGEFQDQLVRNTGLSDEVAGGVSFLAQGAENIGRRVLGKPVEIPAASAAKAGVDYDREQRTAYAQKNPVGNALAYAGGMAASGVPRGALAALSPLKAGAGAAAANLPFAIGRQEGSLMERAPGAAVETALSFGLGSTLQAGSNALGRSVARTRAAPMSDARKLSSEGVQLTPGMMAGGILKRVEDASTSVPGVGDAIRARQVDALTSFDKVAIGRGLEPIGATLPAGAEGRKAIEEANKLVSDAYTNALTPVTIAPDAQLTSDIANIINSAPVRVKDGVKDLVDEIVHKDFAGPISGQQWKAIDEELGKVVASANTAAAKDPLQRTLATALKSVQDAHRAALARANPIAAAEVKKADEAFSNMVRINGAAQSTATAKTDGRFTAAQLNNSVARSGGKRAYGEGRALMQDLSDPATRVLPSSVPDSGTPLRSIVALGGMGGALAGAGQVGLGAIATPAAGAALGINALGMAAYSKPVQKLVNAIYRASSPGQARAALSELEGLAAKNPGLAPVYRQAAEQLGVRPPQIERRQGALADQ